MKTIRAHVQAARCALRSFNTVWEVCGSAFYENLNFTFSYTGDCFLVTWLNYLNTCMNSQIIFIIILNQNLHSLTTFCYLIQIQESGAFWHFLATTISENFIDFQRQTSYTFFFGYRMQINKINFQTWNFLCYWTTFTFQWYVMIIFAIFSVVLSYCKLWTY